MPGIGRIVVIGGGPAALMAAIAAATTGRQAGLDLTVTVLERNSRFGRKLLASGSGQCNLTHNLAARAMEGHYGNHGVFLRQALALLPPRRLMDTFAAWGLETIVRDDGKVFPRSLKSADVLAMLVNQCRSVRVELLTERRVTQIEHQKEEFLVHTATGSPYPCDAVIIATGGVTWSTTGSTGDGYRLAASFGHAIITPHPGLTAILTPGSTIVNLSGLTFPAAALGLVKQGIIHPLETGPLLVTHTGLSGPLVLDASRYLAEGDEISVCFTTQDGRVPSVDAYRDLLVAQSSTEGRRQVRSIVCHGGLPVAFVDWLLASLGIDGSRKAAELGKKHYNQIAQAIVDHRFTISLEGCLEHAMVTAGGIALEQIDAATMASQLVAGLFFAGEVLDIDGDTGGFNLHAAWATGRMAGMNAAIYCKGL